MVVGDFNQILSANEHFSVLPHPLPLTGMSEFSQCLMKNDLSDLPSRGAFYTWTNNQPDDPVLRKLDRVLVNDHWRDTFPEAIATYDSPGDSDHSPALVYTSAHIQKNKNSFKYFSLLSTHPRFKEIISAAWSEQTGVGSGLFTFAQKMKNVKASCKQLNREGFGNLQQRIKESLEQLESIQAEMMRTPTDSLFREEFVARQTWNFFAKALESFYREKSRVGWPRLWLHFLTRGSVGH
ncbi:PREDICTED: uncharacterized protein LOC104757403 [Camelina sativa]|uniref:Uncharacterized protein LOC104757403 n=1 Tax=Camelina sativa TaxID=90675 RepID=A0ABM1R8C7_CAMSA|nr:PREDICTED: uncharacterized protein LOC104757403 [Camelina sativa]